MLCRIPVFVIWCVGTDQILTIEHVLIRHNRNAPDAERALMVVVGVADFSAHPFDESHRSDPALAIASVPANAVFKLLLAHQPRSAAAATQAGFDLQLSGHTHGGQFWPWSHFVKLQQPFTAGLHKLQSMWGYASRATGYWGPLKRFGVPSEITLLRLVRAFESPQRLHDQLSPRHGRRHLCLKMSPT